MEMWRHQSEGWILGAVVFPSSTMNETQIKRAEEMADK